jgi:hypothetical protein
MWEPGPVLPLAVAAGVTEATVGPRQRESFAHVGELVTKLFPLAARLVFRGR